MNDITHTFKSLCGNFQITVKREFLANCPDPDKQDLRKLLTEHKLGQFLHNPYGPALLNIKNNFGEFWLEGKKCKEDVAEQIKHAANFNTTFDEILKS